MGGEPAEDVSRQGMPVYGGRFVTANVTGNLSPRRTLSEQYFNHGGSVTATPAPVAQPPQVTRYALSAEMPGVRSAVRTTHFSPMSSPFMPKRGNNSSTPKIPEVEQRMNAATVDGRGIPLERVEVLTRNDWSMPSHSLLSVGNPSDAYGPHRIQNFEAATRRETQPSQGLTTGIDMASWLQEAPADDFAAGSTTPTSQSSQCEPVSLASERHRPHLNIASLTTDTDATSNASSDRARAATRARRSEVMQSMQERAVRIKEQSQRLVQRATGSQVDDMRSERLVQRAADQEQIPTSSGDICAPVDVNHVQSECLVQRATGQEQIQSSTAYRRPPADMDPEQRGRLVQSATDQEQIPGSSGDRCVPVDMDHVQSERLVQHSAGQGQIQSSSGYICVPGDMDHVQPQRIVQGQSSSEYRSSPVDVSSALQTDDASFSALMPDIASEIGSTPYSLRGSLFVTRSEIDILREQMLQQTRGLIREAIQPNVVYDAIAHDLQLGSRIEDVVRKNLRELFQDEVQQCGLDLQSVKNQLDAEGHARRVCNADIHARFSIDLATIRTKIEETRFALEAAAQTEEEDRRDEATELRGILDSVWQETRTQQTVGTDRTPSFCFHPSGGVGENAGYKEFVGDQEDIQTLYRLVQESSGESVRLSKELEELKAGMLDRTRIGSTVPA